MALLVASTWGRALVVVQRRADRNGRAEYSMTARAVTRNTAAGGQDLSDALYGHRFSKDEVPALVGAMKPGEIRRIDARYSVTLSTRWNGRGYDEDVSLEFTSERLLKTQKARHAYRKRPSPSPRTHSN